MKMLSASSPIAYPQSSSPPPPKRPRPHNQDRPKPRAKGPFILDDDESGEETSTQDAEHVAKRRMLHHPAEAEAVSTAAGVEPIANHGQQQSQTANGGDGDARRGPPSPGPQPLLSMLPGPHSLFSRSLLGDTGYALRTCGGTTRTIRERRKAATVSYESMVAARSKTREGRARRSYYGIEIHELIDMASKDLANQQRPQAPEPNQPVRSVEEAAGVAGKKPKKSLLWTEKYRARNFMDLCGDDGTNRMVLRWLKKWDPLVFPGAAKPKPSAARRPATKPKVEEKPHRKILMLTGPPGLGKTTLAHVCARQAGYEVVEINASDDRSRDVVKNRIRTSLGTQSVKTVTNTKDGKTPQKAARPVCVVVDEVDGVVSGSGASGEGGFVKALIDLVLVDQKNALATGKPTADGNRKRKKGDDFRLMRPLILICNDVYHPSLRPLRQSNLADIIHVGRPSIDAVVGRLKTVFEKEGIPCEKDAARKLCEAAWDMAGGSAIDAKRGAASTVEGDLRGVMVVGEWVAGRFRASLSSPAAAASNGMLTRQWVENHVLHDVAGSAAGARGLGRGSVRDIVNRLFQEGGGFPKQAVARFESKTRHEQPRAELGFGEQQKKQSMDRLAQMVNASGEVASVVAEVFAEYPNREFNDDCYLSKPNEAYDWLHFHDACQSRLYASQEWELAPYLCQPVLACHHLFASPRKHPLAIGGFDRRRGDADDDSDPPAPFSGPRAEYQAREAERQTRAQLQALQAQLSPSLMRAFRSADDVATEFLPYLVRMVSPDVKPVVVNSGGGGGGQGPLASVRKERERAMVRRASEVLAEVGVALHRGRLENEGRAPQYVYRMDPDLDALSAFETAASLVSSQAPTRYAVRQVLDQELQRTMARRETTARQARLRAGNPSQPAAAPPRPAPGAKENRARKDVVASEATVIKRDFFGRAIEVLPLAARAAVNGSAEAERERERRAKEERKVWVTFHEGLNNAVRKPISLHEFMRVL